MTAYKPLVRADWVVYYLFRGFFFGWGVFPKYWEAQKWPLSWFSIEQVSVSYGGQGCSAAQGLCSTPGDVGWVWGICRAVPDQETMWCLEVNLTELHARHAHDPHSISLTQEQVVLNDWPSKTITQPYFILIYKFSKNKTETNICVSDSCFCATPCGAESVLLALLRYYSRCCSWNRIWCWWLNIVQSVCGSSALAPAL